MADALLRGSSVCPSIPETLISKLKSRGKQYEGQRPVNDDTDLCFNFKELFLRGAAVGRGVRSSRRLPESRGFEKIGIREDWD